MKKQIPNILTTLRIIASLCLIACHPLAKPFVCVYALAGISDMLDGFAARKLNASSRFGEKYDSVADLIFIAVCLIKLLPVLHLRNWHIIWLVLIAAIKGINLLISFISHRKTLFLHTTANRITGLMLFVSPILLVWLPVDWLFPVLAATATFAAVQEGYYVISKPGNEANKSARKG